MSSILYKHPVIVGFGKDRNSLTETAVVVEKDNVIRTPDLTTAVHCAFSLYYIFDIAYSKTNKGLMVFLEQLVYKLKPSVAPSTTATIMMDSILRM